MPFNEPTITRKSSGRITGDDVEYTSGTPSFTLASAPPRAADGLGSLPPGNPFVLVPSSCDGSGHVTVRRADSTTWAAAFTAGRRVKVRMRINETSEEDCTVQLRSAASVSAMVRQARSARDSAEKVVTQLSPLIKELEELARQLDDDPDCRP